MPEAVARPPARGKVIPALIASKSLEDLQRSVNRVDLTGMLPFRLIGIFPEERQICEWSWRTEAMALQSLEWKSQHWFSSSLSDQLAAECRGAECSRARKKADAGSTAWLRKLHASHSEEIGFGMCVHRHEVQTLSYTEISFTPARVEMGHMTGSPCAQGPIQLLWLRNQPLGNHNLRFCSHATSIHTRIVIPSEAEGPCVPPDRQEDELAEPSSPLAQANPLGVLASIFLLSSFSRLHRLPRNQTP